MKTAIATALMLLAGATSAHEIDMSAANEIPAYDVTVIESVEGEGKTAFVKRAAETFRAYTAETGYEACGWIAYGGKAAFTIKVVTLKAQVGCGVSKANVVPGTAAGTELIHSHPVKRVVRLTAIDMKLRGNPAGQLRTESVDRCRFSVQDYQNPGYLVACDKIFYQTGRGTEKEI